MLERLHALNLAYPGCRQLWIRQSCASLRKSVLVEYETNVLAEEDQSIRNAIIGTTTRARRDEYVYPNGSTVLVGGVDDPEKWRSTQFNVVVLFEATGISRDAYEEAGVRARPTGLGCSMPFQQVIADTNPAHEGHYLNQMAKDGLLARIEFRHTDNPTCTPEYLERLSRLVGPRRDRLYLGKWVSAEGLIYKMWAESMHVIDRGILPDPVCYFASVDWGYSDASVIQVWMVGSDDRFYRVCEVYKTDLPIDGVRDVMLDINDRYPLRGIACDRSRPDLIRLFNDSLSAVGGRAIAVGVNNNIEYGISVCQQMLLPGPDGIPRARFVRDPHEFGLDQELVAARKPYCFEDEVVDYIYSVSERTGLKSDKPDARTVRHALDTFRYGMCWAREQEFSSSWADVGLLPKTNRASWRDHLQESPSDAYTLSRLMPLRIRDYGDLPRDLIAR